MVRNSVRKTQRSSYLKQNLYEPVQDNKNRKLSSYTASQRYKIPQHIIMDHVMNRHGRSKTLGRDVALSREIEDLLVRHLQNIELHSFGLSKKEVLELVGNYIVKNNIPTPFKNGIPGDEWFLGFRKRHNLAVRVEQRKKSAPVRLGSPEPVTADSTHEETHSDDSVINADEEDSALCAFSWEKTHDAIPCTDEPTRNTSSSAGISAERDDDEFKSESHNDKPHLDFKCNECGGEIIGYRYTCVQCCDFDLCSACEASGAHPEHYVLRLPRPEPAGAVKGVLETLRGLMDQELLLHLPQDRIKMEVDDEDPLHELTGLRSPEPTNDEPDDYEFEGKEEEEKHDFETLSNDSRETHADTNVENTAQVPLQTNDKAEAAPIVQDSGPDKKYLLSVIKVKKPKQVKPLLVDTGIIKFGSSVGLEPIGVGMFGAGVPGPGTGVRVTGAGVTVPGTGVRVTGAGVTVPGTEVRVSRTGETVPGTEVRLTGTGVTVPGTEMRVTGFGMTVRGTGVTVPGTQVRVSEPDVRASGGDVRVSGAGVRLVGARVTVTGTEVRVSEPDVRVSEAGMETTGAEVRASGGNVRVSGAGINVPGAGITVSRAGAASVGGSGAALKRTAVVKLKRLGAIELGEAKISLVPRSRKSYRDK